MSYGLHCIGDDREQLFDLKNPLLFFLSTAPAKKRRICICFSV